MFIFLYGENRITIPTLEPDQSQVLGTLDRNGYTHSKKIPEVLRRVIDRKDHLIFPASEEDIDINEAKYFCFPNYVTERFKVSRPWATKKP